MDKRTTDAETAVEQVLAEAEALKRDFGISASDIGRDAVGTDRVLFRLRDGKDAQWSTVVRLSAWMRGYRAGRRNA